MYNAVVRNGETSEKLIGIASISEVKRTSRFHLYDHVERKAENDCIKCVKHFEEKGSAPMEKTKENIERGPASKRIDRQAAINSMNW